MLMTKGLDLKILYTLLIAVSGIVLTIGAASALMVYAENLEVDNQTGDSSIKVTSSTGDSKIILEDQGVRTWSVMTDDGKKKFQITDENVNKPRLTIKKTGQVGIGTANPQAKLHVAGTFKTNGDANIGGDLNVNGVLTGAYIATLEATILDLQTRLAALESGTDQTVPMVSMVLSNEGMIETNGAMISNNAGNITLNQEEIAANAAAIEEGGGGPNVCNPDGDSEITAQEIKDYLDSVGISFTTNSIKNKIGNAENAAGTLVPNFILDDAQEVAAFNSIFMIPVAGISCTYL